jgi:NADP-dependent 3-hydroxy acid dehydrogenase YdfG
MEKIILITGATSGFGKAIAENCIRKVELHHYRTKGRPAAPLADELREISVRF